MKLLPVILLAASANSYADGILLSVGQSTTTDENSAHKIAYIYDVEKPWSFIANNNFYLEWEASYFIWENKYGDDITGGSLNPMFGYKLPYKNNEFFVRVGIGVAYIDQVRWGNRKLGANWTFEDKIELGYSVNNNHLVGLSLTHYSNAGTNKHNDGVNIYSLNYSYKW